MRKILSAAVFRPVPDEPIGCIVEEVRGTGLIRANFSNGGLP
jgi:hypothetical protein